MRKALAIAAALLATGCATNPGANGSIKDLGNDQYSISEMGVFGGNLAEHAARYCASKSQKMKVEGNTTQTGLASGTAYPVLIFSCHS